MRSHAVFAHERLTLMGKARARLALPSALVARPTDPHETALKALEGVAEGCRFQLVEPMPTIVCIDLRRGEVALPGIKSLEGRPSRMAVHLFWVFGCVNGHPRVKEGGPNLRAEDALTELGFYSMTLNDVANKCNTETLMAIKNMAAAEKWPRPRSSNLCRPDYGKLAEALQATYHLQPEQLAHYMHVPPLAAAA